MGMGTWFGRLAAILAIMAFAGEASAQRPGGGRGGRPSFDNLLEAFDQNDDGTLGQDEVPGRVWSRLSQADADGDGIVTRKEFDDYRPGAK